MATQVGTYKRDWTRSRIEAGVLQGVETSLPPDPGGRYAGKYSTAHWVPADGGLGAINATYGDMSRDLWLVCEVQAEADGGDRVKARLQVHLHKDRAAVVRADDPFVVEVGRLLGKPVDVEGWREWRGVHNVVSRNTAPEDVFAFYDAELARLLGAPVPAGLPGSTAPATRPAAAPVAAGSRQGQRWTHDELAELAQEAAKGLDVATVAERHGRTTGAINATARNMLRPAQQPEDYTQSLAALSAVLAGDPGYDWSTVHRDNKRGVASAPSPVTAAPAPTPAPAAPAAPTASAPTTVPKSVFLASKITGYPMARAVRHSIRTKLRTFGFDAYVAESDMIGGFQQSHIDRMIETSEHLVVLIWDSIGPATLAEVELAMRTARRSGAPVIHVFLSTNPDHIAARDSVTRAFLDEMDRQRLYAHFFAGDKELTDAVTNLFVDLSLV